MKVFYRVHERQISVQKVPHDSISEMLGDDTLTDGGSMFFSLSAAKTAAIKEIAEERNELNAQIEAIRHLRSRDLKEIINNG